MMSARKASYDTKCWDLAEAFLEDEPHLATTSRTEELAELIQRTIEDFISHERTTLEADRSAPESAKPPGKALQ